MLDKVSEFVYKVKIGNSTKLAHINQLSRYFARDNIFDMMGAKKTHVEAFFTTNNFSFSAGTERVEQQRPVRERRKPERFEPAWFKTRQHPSRSRKQKKSRRRTT